MIKALICDLSGNVFYFKFKIYYNNCEIFNLGNRKSENIMDMISLIEKSLGKKAKIIRDVCVTLGIALTIEDTWGRQIADAAIAHLAHSTPSEFHFQSSAFQEYTNVNIAKSDLKIIDGFMQASELPGLGVEPNYEVLGNPVEEIL